MTEAQRKSLAIDPTTEIIDHVLKSNFADIPNNAIERAKQDQSWLDFAAELRANPAKMKKHIEKLKKEMLAAAADLEFETAADLRDQIKRLEDIDLGLP